MAEIELSENLNNTCNHKDFGKWEKRYYWSIALIPHLRSGEVVQVEARSTEMKVYFYATCKNCGAELRVHQDNIPQETSANEAYKKFKKAFI